MPLREPARVLMHLDGGFTKVVLERTTGSGTADGGIDWDIPTDRIPFPLRAMGSRLLITTGAHDPGPNATLAAACDFTVEPLPP